MAKQPYRRLEHLKQLLRIELASEQPGLLYVEDLKESIEREEKRGSLPPMFEMVQQ